MFYKQFVYEINSLMNNCMLLLAKKSGWSTDIKILDWLNLQLYNPVNMFTYVLSF